MKSVPNKVQRPITLERLALRMDKGFEDTAVMIKKGFDNVPTKQDLLTAEKSLRSDITLVKGQMSGIDERLQVMEVKLDRALYTELSHLEARVKRIEQKVGIAN